MKLKMNIGVFDTPSTDFKLDLPKKSGRADRTEHTDSTDYYKREDNGGRR